VSGGGKRKINWRREIAAEKAGGGDGFGVLYTAVGKEEDGPGRKKDRGREKGEESKHLTGVFERLMAVRREEDFGITGAGDNPGQGAISTSGVNPTSLKEPFTVGVVWNDRFVINK
jgi:hypothetical protein